jgi:antitoxin component YwqK of YwqJK toxin-antitoxin module
MTGVNNPKSIRPAAALKVGLLLALVVAILVALIPSPRQPPPPLEVPRTELALRNGLLYRNNEPLPFTGSMIELHTNGALKSRSSVAEGLLEGISQGWYTNGVLQVRENFQHGVSHGRRTKWHENGKLMSEGTIDRGQHHGLFRRWHENGQLAEEVTLVHGKADGLSRSYHPSGCLKARVVLKMGEVIEREFWNDGEKQLASSGGLP